MFRVRVPGRAPNARLAQWKCPRLLSALLQVRILYRVPYKNNLRPSSNRLGNAPLKCRMLGSIPTGRTKNTMVAVAKWLRRQVVALIIVRSNRIRHPKCGSSQIGRDSGLRSRVLRVRVSPPAPAKGIIVLLSKPLSDSIGKLKCGSTTVCLTNRSRRKQERTRLQSGW